MKKINPKTLLVIFLFSVLAAACSPNPGLTASPTSTPMTPAKGKAILVGFIKDNLPAGWAMADMNVYAAPFYGDNEGKGVFVYDASYHPQTKVNPDGSFRFMDFPPGRYVLAVGPTPEESRPIPNDQNQPRVFTIDVDKMVDVGTLSLSK